MNWAYIGEMIFYSRVVDINQVVDIGETDTLFQTAWLNNMSLVIKED